MREAVIVSMEALSRINVYGPAVMPLEIIPPGPFDDLAQSFLFGIPTIQAIEMQILNCRIDPSLDSLQLYSHTVGALRRQKCEAAQQAQDFQKTNMSAFADASNMTAAFMGIQSQVEMMWASEYARLLKFRAHEQGLPQLPDLLERAAISNRLAKIFKFEPQYVSRRADHHKLLKNISKLPSMQGLRYIDEISRAALDDAWRHTSSNETVIFDSELYASADRFLLSAYQRTTSNERYDERFIRATRAFLLVARALNSM